jgi:hypothetical protein
MGVNRGPMKPMLAMLAGCIYSHGELATFPGSHVQLSCIDLGVASYTDDVARGPIVDYHFGNRCAHDTVIDLATVRATARQQDGRVVKLRAYDPDRELRPVTLYARLSYDEQIAYQDDASIDSKTICVEIGHVDRGDPAPRDQWICPAGAR